MTVNGCDNPGGFVIFWLKELDAMTSMAGGNL